MGQAKTPKKRSAKRRKAVSLSEYLRGIGSRGGKARAKNLTANERSEGAQKAAQARWSKTKKLR